MFKPMPLILNLDHSSAENAPRPGSRNPSEPLSGLSEVPVPLCGLVTA